MTLFIFAMVIGYLTLGVCIGSATARAGYALDRHVRLAENNLNIAIADHRELVSQIDKIDPNAYWEKKSQVDKAHEDVREAQRMARKTFDSNLEMYRTIGMITIFSWPVCIAGAIVAGVSFALWKVMSIGINYAVQPSRYETHEALLKGEIQ